MRYISNARSKFVVNTAGMRRALASAAIPKWTSFGVSLLRSLSFDPPNRELQFGSVGRHAPRNQVTNLLRIMGSFWYRFVSVEYLTKCRLRD